MFEHVVGKIGIYSRFYGQVVVRRVLAGIKYFMIMPNFKIV